MEYKLVGVVYAFLEVQDLVVQKPYEVVRSIPLPLQKNYYLVSIPCCKSILYIYLHFLVLAL